MLADVLSRDGAEQSASAIRQRNLANADHLAILHAIWTAETQAARHDRYRELVMAALPPGHRQPLSHQARWLYRTLHAAELAGLDPADVIRTAIASRDLAGSRDIAAVLDARIRPRIDPLLPQPQGPWTGRVPELPDPDRQAYLAQIAAMMDDRTRRLGQHAAQTAPPGQSARSARCPPTPAARRRLGTQGRLDRRLPGDVRLRPSRRPDRSRAQPRKHPDQRAAWHEAFAALGPAGQPDVRAMPDGRLWLIRDSLRRPDRLGTPPRRERAAAGPARRLRRRPGRHPRRRRSRRRPQGRRPRPRRAARAPGRQLPGPARPLPAARTGPRPGHGRPAGMGARHRPVPPPGHRRRRRTAPPPPRPEDRAAALRPNQPLPATPNASSWIQPRTAKLTETAAWIRDLAVQRQAFRAEIDERQGLMVPGEDPAGATSARPFLPGGRPAGMRSCSRPNRRSPPRREILQLAAEHDIEPEAGG